MRNSQARYSRKIRHIPSHLFNLIIRKWSARFCMIQKPVSLLASDGRHLHILRPPPHHVKLAFWFFARVSRITPEIGNNSILINREMPNQYLLRWKAGTPINWRLSGLRENLFASNLRIWLHMCNETLFLVSFASFSEDLQKSILEF